MWWLSRKWSDCLLHTSVMGHSNQRGVESVVGDSLCKPFSEEFGLSASVILGWPFSCCCTHMKEVCFEKAGPEGKEESYCYIKQRRDRHQMKDCYVFLKIHHPVRHAVSCPFFTNFVTFLWIHEKGKCFAFSSWQCTREVAIHFLYISSLANPYLHTKASLST